MLTMLATTTNVVSARGHGRDARELSGCFGVHHEVDMNVTATIAIEVDGLIRAERAVLHDVAVRGVCHRR